MERFLTMHFMISVHCTLAALIVAIGAFALYSAKNDTRMLLTGNIERQSELMAELAYMTDSNIADLVVERIITDCPRRNEFERLLGQLGTLGHQKLLEVQQLFESCGGFFAERKALMVSRFEREFEVLKENAILMEALDGTPLDAYQINEWASLLALEQRRSDLLNEQLLIQRDIIHLLIEGKTVRSSEITEYVDRASQVAEALRITDAEIDALRETLVL